MWPFWLFAALPLVEIALFITVGGLIGVWATLGLVLVSAVLGIVVIRSQGAHALREIQKSVAQLRDPSRTMAHGVMLVAAGLLLIIPGFLTDAIALALLIPPVRDLLMRRAGSRLRVRSAAAAAARREAHRPPYAGGVVDAEFEVEDERPPREQDGRALPADAPREPRPGGRPARLRPDGSGWTRH